MTIKDSDPEGPRQLRKLRVSAFPTFILLDGSGREIERWAGFGKSKGFIETLDAAAADPRPLTEKIAAFDAAPSALLALRIAGSLAFQNRPLDALGFYERAAKLDPALEKQVAYERFTQTYGAVCDGLLPFESLLAAGRLALQYNPKEKWTVRFVASTLVETWPDDIDRSGLRPFVDPALATYKKKPRDDWEKEQKRQLEEALGPRQTLDQRIAEFEKAPTADAALQLGRELQELERYPEALAIFHRVGALDAKQEADTSVWVLVAAARGAQAGSVPAGTVEQAYERHLALHAGEADAATEAASYLAIGLSQGQDNAYLQPRLDAAIAALEQADDAEKKATLEQLRIVRARAVEGDPTKAIRLKKESLGDGWNEDPDQLTDLAVFLARNDLDLAQAESVARRAVELSEPGRERSQAADALARVLERSGQREAAIAAIEDALKNAPYSRALRQRLAALKAAA